MSDVGQVWSVDATGGYMYSANLSKKLRTAVQTKSMFRQFCDIKDGTFGGLSKGSKFHWNVYSNAVTQGAALTENDNDGTNPMPVTNFTITQGELTVTEYGNSVPYTGKLDALSEHPVTEIINKVLKNDSAKAFDIAAHAQFDLAPLQYVAKTNGASTMVAATDYVLAVTGPLSAANTWANASALNIKHIVNINDIMKERNIPTFANDSYYCVAKPSTFSGFKTQLEGIQQYTPQGFGFIMNGEIGRYRGNIFVEQTNIASTGTYSTNSMSGDAYFFGEDTVAEAVVIPEEIRGMIPQDYGRTKGIAWYYLGGFGLCHTTAMGEAQARILKWTSGTKTS